MPMPRDLLGIPLLVYYPALAFILLGIALASIPRAHIKRLFVESLLWGLLTSFLFDVATRALGLFHYVHQGPFTLLGSPIWLNLAWSPAIMVFLYFKPPMSGRLLFSAYLLTYSLLSAMLNEALQRLGLLVPTHWSSLARFVVAVPWFLGASFFHERYMAKQARGRPG